MGNCPARAWQFLCLQLGLGNTQARGMSFPFGWLTGTSKAKRPKPHSFPPQQAQSLSCIPILMTGTFIYQDAQKGNLTAISNVSISRETNPTSSPRLWVIRSCVFFLLNCCNLSTWMTFSPDNSNSPLCTVLPAVTFYPPKLSLSITSSRQASWTQVWFWCPLGIYLSGPSPSVLWVLATHVSTTSWVPLVQTWWLFSPNIHEIIFTLKKGGVSCFAILLSIHSCQ